MQCHAENACVNKPLQTYYCIHGHTYKKSNKGIISTGQTSAKISGLILSSLTSIRATGLGYKLGHRVDDRPGPRAPADVMGDL